MLAFGFQLKATESPGLKTEFDDCMDTVIAVEFEPLPVPSLKYASLSSFIAPYQL